MRWYIISEDTEITESVKVAAAAAGAKQIAKGIPPRFANILAGVSLPTVYDEPSKTLDEIKIELYNQIDTLTEHKIHEGKGFEYPPGSGLFYSTSANAQSKWIALEVGRNEIDYVNDPPKVRTYNNAVTTTLPDAATVHNMYLTGLVTIKSLLAEGGAVKDNVRAATTEAEARAATDSYLKNFA